MFTRSASLVALYSMFGYLLVWSVCGQSFHSYTSYTYAYRTILRRQLLSIENGIPWTESVLTSYSKISIVCVKKKNFAPPLKEEHDKHKTWLENNVKNQYTFLTLKSFLFFIHDVQFVFNVRMFLLKYVMMTTLFICDSYRHKWKWPIVFMPRELWKCLLDQLVD